MVYVRADGTLRGGGGGAYSAPTFPAAHASEVYSSAMDSLATPNNDASGGNRHLVAIGTVTQRPVPSRFPGMVACALDTGAQRMGLVDAVFQRNTEWTVDMVCERPAEGNTNFFAIAPTALTSYLGGLRVSGSHFLEVHSGAAWVNTGISIEDRYFEFNVVPGWALTLQWGSDNKLRLWINGFLFYESPSALTPPTVLGTEGLQRYGLCTHFLRYIAAAPANPHAWHASALYGASA